MTSVEDILEPRTGLQRQIGDLSSRLAGRSLRPRYGELLDIRGPVMRVALDRAHIGDICRVRQSGRARETLGEVIGVEKSMALLSPFGSTQGLSAGAYVYPGQGALRVPVGPSLFGRVLDGLGRVIDDGPPLAADIKTRPARGEAPEPMTRPLIEEPLATGLRAVDGLTTLGRGQRVGIFGPPGTGKSSLLAALASHCEADAIVIGLIGERGREVREFLDRNLPKSERGRVIVVAATSDRSPMERVYGSHVATAIAEDLRDRGKSVLLMIDSLTRVARALREVGLAAGETPTRRGYPASVYPALPALIERAGRGVHGDITAVYTVLVEGDGEGDPIAEEARSLTDGHITLSARVADAGRYPAIDILQSLSRVMSDVVTPEHRSAASETRKLLAKYEEIEVLLQVGEYQKGSDPEADRAVERIGPLRDFLTQDTRHKTTLPDTIELLQRIVQ